MTKQNRAALARSVFPGVAWLFFALAAIAAENTLTADSMRYDPNSGVITATGHVRVTSPDGEVSGDEGSGDSEGTRVEMRGGVNGRYRDRDGGTVIFSCGAVTVNGRDASNRVVTASGGVKITKGRENLSAETVVWYAGVPKYSASGGVLGEFSAYSIDADTVSRDVESFSASNVRKFHEHNRSITMSAAHAEGVIKKDEITEMTAEGDVVITMPGKDGVITRATGRKSIYSLERGTVVLSGGAAITQTGRVLRSDSVVYFLDSGHIDAHGSPSITFETDRKK